jgi:preprotein translocase subunit SecF
MDINFIKKRNIWFAISGALVTLSILAIGFLGLEFGIDFTGGSLLEVRVEQQVDNQEVSAMLAERGYDGARVQSAGESDLLIRTASLSEDEHQKLLGALQENYEGVEEMRFQSIGPTIGQELQRSSLMAVAITLTLIGLYVAWAFRKVSEPVESWKYGILTIMTAFHDVLIAVGAFSVLGWWHGWEVGTAFVAAALTILGYSINDTVVVFDRTRENLAKRVGEKFEETVDKSIKETFRRSFFTSVTTLLALLAIFFFGGESTQPFALALIIGISVGTYSSLFLASPALVEWHKRTS